MVNSAIILARENRLLIKGIKDDIKEIKIGMEKISNHYSKRLPGWATATITILGALVTGLIVAAVK